MKTFPWFLMLLAASIASATEDNFDAHWRDGNAEINGYRLTVSRYGQNRTGEAALIYVTEPFSESKRVKLDNPAKTPSDTVDVLKLNLVRDFQTGIYDYNTMVSTFVRTHDFTPLKVSFSSAEWCGHVYEELLFHPDKVVGSYNSYFEGESGRYDLGHPKDGVAEDNLFIVLRGLRSEFLKPGESRRLPMLTGVFFGRLAHKPLQWLEAEISRSAKTERVAVPAGEFECTRYEVRTGDGRTGRFLIETAYPHRIVRWELAPDVSAELTGSRRLQYWKLNGNGQESLRKEALGLPR